MHDLPLPVDADWLDRFQLHARKLHRASASGGHLTRKMGRSLEFREFSTYVPGDNVRDIDWRTTFRRATVTTPGKMPLYRDWMVRRFDAEEGFRIVISIDNRSTMTLPETDPRRGIFAPSKLQIARWIAESVARIAHETRDRVTIHSLFGSAPAEETRGGEAAREAVLTASVLADDMPAPLNLTPLERALPPSAVWIILSDYYCDVETCRQLAARIREAHDGLRWVIRFNFDTWPYEKNLLQGGTRTWLLQGPGSGPKRVQIENSLLREAETEIEQRHRALQDAGETHQAGKNPWRWKTAYTLPTDSAEFFRTAFADDSLIKSLFMRDE